MALRAVPARALWQGGCDVRQRRVPRVRVGPAAHAGDARRDGVVAGQTSAAHGGSGGPVQCRFRPGHGAAFASCLRDLVLAHWGASHCVADLAHLGSRARDPANRMPGVSASHRNQGQFRWLARQDSVLELRGRRGGPATDFIRAVNCSLERHADRFAGRYFRSMDGTDDEVFSRRRGFIHRARWATTATPSATRGERSKQCS